MKISKMDILHVSYVVLHPRIDFECVLLFTEWRLTEMFFGGTLFKFETQQCEFW